MVAPELESEALHRVTEFCRDRLAPLVQQIEDSNRVPPALISEASELGLFGLSIPKEFGGIGLTLSQKCAVEEVIGATPFGFATVLGNHNGIGTAGLVGLGTADQKRKYLPEMATGRMRGVFCLTEPGAGSDAASVETTVQETHDGLFALDGDKTLITQAPVGGLFTVVARDGDGLSMLLVERQTPGLDVGAPTPILGMRGSSVAPVSFRACRVGPSAILGERGRGLRQALGLLNQGRIAMSARIYGLGRAALKDAVRYANEREQFGRALIKNQGLAWRLAELSTRMNAAGGLLYAAAAALDAGEPARVDVAMAKYFVTETVWRVADEAVQVFGGLGYTMEGQAQRYLRDARVTRIYEGSSEVQLDIIGRSLAKNRRTTL